MLRYTWKSPEKFGHTGVKNKRVIKVHLTVGTVYKDTTVIVKSTTSYQKLEIIVCALQS